MRSTNSLLPTLLLPAYHPPCIHADTLVLLEKLQHFVNRGPLVCLVAQHQRQQLVRGAIESLSKPLKSDAFSAGNPEFLQSLILLGRWLRKAADTKQLAQLILVGVTPKISLPLTSSRKMEPTANTSTFRPYFNPKTIYMGRYQRVAI